MNYLNQPIKMTDWPVDARAFSRPTSKPREKRPGDEVETTRFRIDQAENAKGLCRGPFLESPGNFARPKSNIQIIYWQFYHIICKPTETSSFNVNDNSFSGPLIDLLSLCVLFC